MRYPAPLVATAEVARERALRVRLLPAQSAPGASAARAAQIIPTPHPVPASAALLDSFTGSGLVLDHTGESGNVWAELYGDSLGNYVLDGAGNLICLFNNTRYLTSDWLPPAGNFFVEVDLVFDAGTGGAVGLFGLDNGDDFDGFELDFQYNIGAATLQTALFMQPVGSSSYFATVDNAAAYGALHTVRVEVSNGNKTCRSLLDGAQQDVHTLAVAMPFPSVIGLFYKPGSDPSKVRVSEIRGDAL